MQVSSVFAAMRSIRTRGFSILAADIKRNEADLLTGHRESAKIVALHLLRDYGYAKKLIECAMEK